MLQPLDGLQVPVGELGDRDGRRPGHPDTRLCELLLQQVYQRPQRRLQVTL